MFTVYLDDSGTSPSQRVAIAAAIIVPTQQIVRLEREWDALRQKEGFSSFHTSEFVASNKRSEFAKWDTAKKQRVFRRVREITKKYGIRGLSFAVHKRDYEETVRGDFRECVGRFHYTWAVRHLLGFIENWRNSPPVARPVEYVFDWLERNDPRRREIENAIDQAEYFSRERGLSTRGFSKYGFKRRVDTPGLQCVDAVGWTSYQYGLLNFFHTPLQESAKPSWKHFEGHLAQNGWLQAVTVTKANLEKWVKLETEDGRTMELFRKWQRSRSG
jgi:hypothetical protein